jgi:ribosomal quality control pathway NFACT family protein/fibronectin-binding protein A (FbpA)
MSKGNEDITRSGTNLLSCYRTVRTMHRPLVGGRIQRVALSALAGREVAIFQVRVPPGPDAQRGENVFLVLAAGMGVGVVDAEGRATLKGALSGALSAGQARWRTQLDGGRIVAVEKRAVGVAREGEIWRVGAESPGSLLLAAVPVDSAFGAMEVQDLAEQGARVVEALVRAGVGGLRDALRRALVKAIARLDRRVAAVQGDLGRIQGAASDAERARLFVAQAAQAPRGATKLVAIDWSSGEGKPVEIALDPARGAQEQLAALFKRARRLKEGGRIAVERLADARKARSALASLVDVIETRPDAALDRLAAEARAAAPRDFRFESSGASRAGPRSRVQAPHPPYRTFTGMSGARIFVGRGAAHNDALTFRIASPHHLWLHAKNRSGAHVVVPLEKGQTCPADVLVEAAHLAAHFSEAREEVLVEVQYTPRRYLRKPRGSAPGLVVVDRENVIVLRREDPLLRRLLERET